MRVGDGRKLRIPAQRQAELRELLKSRGAASVTEIARTLSVSESTARRDIDKLAKEGIVSRSHGGAVNVERTTFEPLFKDRQLQNTDEKVRIGHHAIILLKPGQSVIFDSSSTVLSAIQSLSRRPVPSTAVTNDANAASALALVPQVNVILPGGEIREGSFTLLGSYTQSFHSRLCVDVALIGIHAITDEVLSEAGLPVAEIKLAMIGAARGVVLLADHSKFGAAAFVEVAKLDVVDDLITDKATPEELLDAAIASLGTRVHVV